MASGYQSALESTTAVVGTQPCVLRMVVSVSVSAAAAPRADTTIMASMAAINARATITRKEEMRNVFMMQEGRLVGLDAGCADAVIYNKGREAGARTPSGHGVNA